MRAVFKYYPYVNILLCTLCWLAGISVAWLISTGSGAGAVTSAQGDDTDLGLNISSHPLINIWSNNLLYAIALVVFGFFSGGVYAVGTFVYNGLIVGLYIRKAMAMGIDDESIIKRLVFHSPFEVFAFILLGALSFRGIHFYKELISGDRVLLQKFIPPVHALVIPFALILVAGVIEYAAILKF